ncbi:rRNA maturation RNase YbeY [Pseudanabaena sp. PCC 6802]|uniref:rRNA maturation RNase YbeY n=1 Tax=Pseudanabaena sp. PCC 6802 TaxID=118173 RepID=UPI00034632EB|nr:rRNA maturation RNase YbeY [Pseudanabaena sp. PCC 6802]
MSIDLHLERNPTITDLDPISVQDWQEWFQVWLQHLQPERDCEIALRLTDDDEIRSLNARYRQQNRPTDVLAFAALEADIPELPPDLAIAVELEPTYLGDIVISAPTALAQSRERGHSHRYELAWLAAHGLLHLLGWDHPDAASLEKMLAQQEALLGLINIKEPDRWSVQPVRKVTSLSEIAHK